MDSRERRFSLLILCAVLFIMAAGGYVLSRSEKEVTLRIGIYAGSYWDTPGAESYQFLDRAIKSFEERYENITVEYVSGISADDYSEWLAEQILKGTEPDLYYVLPENFSLLVTSGALEQLSGYMIADEDFDRDAFFDTCPQAGMYHGIQYALPQESAPTIMFVNKTLLRDCGIEMPSVDWTWNDFYTICEQVTDVQKHRYGVYGYTWLNAAYSNGTEVFSEDGTQCDLTDKKMTAAVRFIKKLENLNQGYTVSQRDFDLGRVAFRPFSFSEYRAYQPYPWRVKKYTEFEWDGICMPAGPYGSNASELQTLLLAVSSRSKHKDEAWEFMKLLCADEELLAEQYLYSTGIAAMKSTLENEITEKHLQKDLPEDTVFDRKMIVTIMENAVSVPRFNKFSQAMSMADAAVRGEVDGTLQTGLYNAQREINQFLQEK